MSARSSNGSSSIGRTIVAIVFFAVVLAVSTWGGQLIGSLLFAKLEKLPTSIVGFTTLYHYWIEFGAVQQVHRALLVSSFMAGFVAIAPAILLLFVVLTGLKRELHGSARFANLREIRDSGLVGSDQ
jgi:type IV secretion system protein VirD4